MTASLLPRNIFRLSGTLLHPSVNRRLCSTGDGGNKKDDNTKLLDFLSKQKKIKKKPVELKAKPVKRNISEKFNLQYLIEKNIGGAFLGAFLRAFLAFLKACLAFLRLFSELV